MIKELCIAFLMTLFAIAAAVCLVGFASAGGCAPTPIVPHPHATTPPTPAPAPAPNPIVHPIKSAQPAVHAIQHPLIIAAVATILLAGAFFGLEFFAPLSLVGKIGFPITGGMALASLLGVFATPFFPYICYGLAALALAFGAYEFFHLKVRQRIEAKVQSALPPAVGPTSTGV